MTLSERIAARRNTVGPDDAGMLTFDDVQDDDEPGRDTKGAPVNPMIAYYRATHIDDTASDPSDDDGPEWVRRARGTSTSGRRLPVRVSER